MLFCVSMPDVQSRNEKKNVNILHVDACSCSDKKDRINNDTGEETNGSQHTAYIKIFRRRVEGDDELNFLH